MRVRCVGTGTAIDRRGAAGRHAAPLNLTLAVGGIATAADDEDAIVTDSTKIAGCHLLPGGSVFRLCVMER